MKNIKSIHFVVFLVLLILTGCKREDPTWDVEILTPLARTSLSIREIVEDESTVSTDENDLVSLVFSNDVFVLENPLDSLVNLSIESFETRLTLQELALAPQVIADTVFLESFNTFEPLPGFSVTINDGQLIPDQFLPNSGIPIQPINTVVDISNFLVEADPSQAFFDIVIGNNTELDIVNLSYSISNTDDGETLISGMVDTIKAKTTFSDLAIDLIPMLNGNTVKGNLTVEVNGISLVRSDMFPNPRFVYADYLGFNARLRDILVNSARAQFPAQSIIDFSDVVDVVADNNVELTFARIETGIVNVKGFSTVPTDIFFNYSVPNISTGNTTFEFDDVVNDSFSSSQNQQIQDFTFNDYNFDFTVQNDSLNIRSNSFINTIKADIEATNGIVDLSLSDTIGLEIGVTELKPSYVRGFLGSNSFEFTDSTDIEILESLKGDINLDQVNIGLEIDNELGIEATLIINSLVAVNTETGQRETYSGNTGPFIINRATELGLDFVSTNTVLQLDNANNLLSILPDRFIFDLELLVNPASAGIAFNDFIHSNANLRAKINIGVPLILSANNLTIEDTIALNPDTREDIIPEEIGRTQLRLIANNGFPLDASVNLFFLNETGIVLDSLTTDQVILSAPLDPVSSRALGQTETTLEYDLNRDRLNTFLNASQVRIEAVFTTEGEGTVEILDSYEMDIQLVGDFDYTVRN